MEEIWKPVPSKPGLMVSNFGRIHFPNRKSKMPNGGEREYKTKPTYGCKTKASNTARHNYMGAYNTFYGNIKVHRVVCEAFHGPPPFKKAVVIHLNENALDNRPENLKWGTQKENLNSPGFIAYCKSRTGENSPTIKGQRKKVELSSSEDKIQCSGTRGQLSANATSRLTSSTANSPCVDSLPARAAERSNV